jgi:hypothetical protein
MRLATTGINADDTAPAATSWNNRSGIRNAAKNASSSWGSRTALTTTTSRTQPRTREMRNAPETISPARARAEAAVTSWWSAERADGPRDRRRRAARRDVRVDLGRREVLVAEQLLHDAEVGAAIKEVRRERVTQRVR